MASGAKRRKAAKKKKKDAAVLNGNGEVKVNESDSGENSSSPASQDLEPQHNPFSKDEDKDPSPGNESKERSKKDGSWPVCKEDEVVEEMVGEAKSSNGELACVTCSSLKDSMDGALKSVGVDDGSQVSEKNIVGLEMHTPEKEHSSTVAETESLAKEVIHDKDAADAVQLFGSDVVVQEKVINAEANSKKNEEKVHPSETSSDLKEPGADESSSLSNTTPSGRPSGETFGIQVRQSNVHTGNGEYLTGNSDVRQNAEKEPRDQCTKLHGQVAVDCSSCLQSRVDNAVGMSCNLKNGRTLLTGIRQHRQDEAIGCSNFNDPVALNSFIKSKKDSLHPSSMSNPACQINERYSLHPAVCRIQTVWFS